MSLLRHAARRGRRTLERGVPVGRAHHDLRAVALLQLRRALVVVAMRVADDHVLDVARIQAELGHPVDDFRPRGPREIRVDDDDPRAGLQRPRGMLARAQPVEVVEHLEGRRIPVGAVRRLWRAARRRARRRHRAWRAAAPRASAARGSRQAEIDERAAVILSRGGLGRGDMRVDLTGRRLGRDGRAQEHGRQ